MTGWHPATKLLLLVALAAVPYLLWTRGDAPPPVAGPPERVQGAAAGGPPPGAAAVAPAAAGGGVLEPYALPPLERFAAIVERPLFSPTRRMPPIEEPPPEVVEAPPEEPPPPPPSGPEEPDLRFFGTVTQGGLAKALVTFPATNSVARLAPGDRVGEWEVREVARNQLVLAAGEEERRFEIFGAGSRAPLADGSAPAPPETPDPGLPAEEQPYTGDESLPEEAPVE